MAANEQIILSVNEIALMNAKAKLAQQFSGNFDPRLGDIYIAPMGGERETVAP